MTTEKHTMVVEVRQNTTDFGTDEAAGTTDVTLVSDDLHPNELKSANRVRVYLDDSHDEALDVEVQHTNTDDDTFDAVTTKTTISLTSGQTEGSAFLEGPIGRIRFVVLASAAAAAPTSGRLKFEVLVKG